MKTETETAIKILNMITLSEGGCWLWNGYIHRDGYGMLQVNGVREQIHRITYRLFVGLIPEGDILHHYYCQTKRCCNPNHVEPMTRKEHGLTADSGGGMRLSRTHCPAGHPYEGENLISVRGERACRTCKLRILKECRLRKKLSRDGL